MPISSFGAPLLCSKYPFKCQQVSNSTVVHNFYCDSDSIASRYVADIAKLPLVNENIREDDQQLQTVVSILQQPKGTVPFIIFGPPGTGKTSAVVESIIQLLNRDPRFKILACTPSNGRCRFTHLMAFRVVLSTCSSAGFLQTENIPVGHFSHIIIDEAAQGRGTSRTNVILAGDPHQLGPVIKSSAASDAGLGKSYLERLMRISKIYGLDTQAGKTIVDLQRNRRSHGTIIAWPNRYLYQDIMRAHASADVSQRIPACVPGIKGQERRTRHSPSYLNILEASVVRDYCLKLTQDNEHKISVDEQEIGVIAPYKAQVRTIRELLKVAKLGCFCGLRRTIQGQERKVIIFATTRSNSEVDKRRAMGFLQNRRRMNVAITRAQALLIVIGDPEVLGKDELWRTFLNYACLRGGWTGKMLTWKPKEEVHVPGYEVIPRPGGAVYGESYVDGKSEKIYRYSSD
ncbi:P-loop containing nucleoside triphosphate hydrolase protein [Lactarius deliciosus]|nr:P-loop containing nucleoside triphosphate hydrolase protein [Lactarius deliciosus]